MRLAKREIKHSESSSQNTAGQQQEIVGINTTVSNSKYLRRTRRPFLIKALDITVVLCVGFFICVYKIGDGSFGNGDQTTHVRVVQEMYYNGNLLHPFYDGRPYFNKPPFKMWLSLIPLYIWGESNFSYRIIDGLSGVFLGLTVFLFSYSLFRSRLSAYLSVIALFSCRVLLYGHGVRNAVQDSMMLLLMSLGTIVGYWICEVARKDSHPALPITTETRRSLWRLALVGGLLIGLGALTKNVAAYFAFVITATYALSTGQIVTIVKNCWKQIVTAVSVSLLIPAAYILAQGENAGRCFQMLIVSEVYKRATKGYHFVKHNSFYWDSIVEQRQAVAPEILFIATTIALSLYVIRKDRRFSMLLVWAYVPLGIQSLAKSKLLWYMLPSIPGMSLLAGAAFGTTILWLHERAKSFIGKTSLIKQRAAFLASSALIAAMLVLFLGTSSLSIADAVNTFMYKQRQHEIDSFVSEIKDFEKVKGRREKVLLFNINVLSRDEVFYMHQLDTEQIKGDLAALEQRLSKGDISFVLAKLTDLPDIARLRPFTSSGQFSFRGRRRKWLGAISYHSELLPRGFSPVETHLNLRTNREIKGFGFKDAVGIGSLMANPSEGPSSSLILRSNYLARELPTEISLHLASVIPATKGKLTVRVFLNAVELESLKEVAEGFNWRKITIPPNSLRDGQNTLTLVYEQPSREEIGSDQQLLLLESLTLRVSSGVH
jgi:4-amino-4-deoxy-L-arabinose transferase-like glycosyltransferase